MKNKILHYALHNAVIHKGEAEVKAVLGKLLSEIPELRKEAGKVKKEVEKIVKKVNKWSHEIRLEKLKELAPHLLERKESKKEENTLSLGDIKGPVTTAFPPEPSGYPHLGHAKAALINYTLAKNYDGKFIVRFEDTNPELAKKEFYKAQLDGLNWLNLKYDKLFYISDTILDIYKKAEKLIEEGKLYACQCTPDIISTNRRNGVICKCVDNSEKENLDYWDKMLKNKFQAGKIIIRFRGDMQNPNTVLRDPTMFRIIDKKHPRLGKKFIVWPSYDFAAAYSDGIEKITHRARSKEFELRAPLQRELQKLMDFEETNMIEFGRFNLEGIESSKRKIRELIEKGELTGWDDPKLSTLVALKKRGFDPEAIKNFLLSTGLTKAEAVYKWESLYAENKKIIDKKANRYFFVENPKKIKIEKTPYVKARIPLHPDFPKRGFKELKHTDEFYIQDELEDNKDYRLMHLFNFKNEEFTSLNPNVKAKIIQWLPVKGNVKTEIVMPDHSVKEGLAESTIKDLKVNDIIQFVRVGFVRLDKKGSTYKFYYTHS